MKWLINLFRRRKNPVYESMTKVVRFGSTIRVWQDEKTFKAGGSREIRFFLNRWDGQNPEGLVKSLCLCFPRIAAVELLDAEGCGGLFYPDWN